MRGFFPTLCIAVLATSSLTFAAPVEARELINIAPVCGTDKNLDSHNCNVALLSLTSDNGHSLVGKTNQVLSSAKKVLTANHKTCKITVEAVGGGESITISKGRIEQIQKKLVAQCGAGAAGVITGEGGSTIRGRLNSGSVKVTFSRGDGSITPPGPADVAVAAPKDAPKTSSTPVVKAPKQSAEATSTPDAKAPMVPAQPKQTPTPVEKTPKKSAGCTA
ncbi:hypothetical protein DFJ77DRAFT_223370 [Powellomyces hirtus]|nr:hypothetical protein DFJ77DRAFT_223370 [Powellomyces hirtus]